MVSTSVSGQLCWAELAQLGSDVSRPTTIYIIPFHGIIRQVVTPFQLNNTSVLECLYLLTTQEHRRASF